MRAKVCRIWIAAVFGLALFCGAQQPAQVTATTENPPAEGKETNPMVTLQTSKGPIKIELLSKEAPVTVKNFLQYVDDKHYDGTIFHRVIDGFMIQGGGFTKDFAQKPTRAPVKNEAANGLKNRRGTVAMARTSDPDSATCQFFINVADNGGLDRPSPDGHGYCVFAKVIEGMEVVDQIKGVRTTTRGPYQNVPAETVEILSVTRD